MKIDKNYEAFLTLLKAGLWEKETRLSMYDNLDFNDVYRLAEEQSVVGVVAAGLEHVIDLKAPRDLSLKFAGQTLQLEQRNLAMNKFIGELISQMRNVGIYTLLVKGQGNAQCYERPLWRTCGDVDLFLSNENYAKAKEYLLPRATSSEQETIYGKHLAMTIDNWEVELHGRLCVSLSSRVNKVLDKITHETFYDGKVRSWKNDITQIFLLNPDNDILYVFAHYLNHFYKGGIGLRQICDWCRLLWIYRETINSKLLEKRLREMGLMTEWKAFGVFAVEYLGMPEEAMPFYETSYLWKRKARKICLFIMKVGNFGHNRDMKYFKKPYVIRKSISFCRRFGDWAHHASIFPIDSLRFLPNIIFRGVRSAIQGE